MSATPSALSVMRTLHFVKRRLRLGCWALSVWLLCAVSVSAQEIIDLPAEDRWLEPRFEEVYRIGSLSGEDWEQFGRVRKVAFNDAGQLYIFDTQADRITARSGAVGFTEIMPDPEGGAVFTVVEAEAAAYTLPGSDSEPTPRRASRRVERLVLSGEAVRRETIAEGWVPEGWERTTAGLPEHRVFSPRMLAGRPPRRERRVFGLVGVRDQDREAGGGGMAHPETPARADPRNETGNRGGKAASFQETRGTVGKRSVPYIRQWSASVTPGESPALPRDDREPRVL